MPRTSGGQSAWADPGAQSSGKRSELQEKMARLAEVDIRRARERRARLPQLDRVEQPTASVALIAAGIDIAASGADALDQTILEKAAVGRGKRLQRRPLFDESRGVQPSVELLRQRVVRATGAAREMIEGNAEAPIDVRLDRVLAGAIGRDVETCPGSGDLGRRAVLVRAAEKQRLAADLAMEAGMDVGRQERAGQIAEMLDAVDVGQGAGDQDFAHEFLRRFGRGARRENEKPSARRAGRNLWDS
jgi:hypothetical protein